ncbi:MAG: crossover junction endodeoxyribonuclease RuvC [Actinomycetia bacterium]|nr:crossover junction endodeoxyribonuclease RuvC [Actinomycetes bacterium]
MFVLGIDPGLTRTGYGIVESDAGRTRAVTAGVIRTDPKVSTAQRLLELRADILGVLDDYTVDCAAIEQVFVNRNRGTAIAVARASGVIMATVAGHGIAVAEYTPSQMKLTITGSGSADKDQIAAVVSMRLGLGSVSGPADVADALGVALCHVQHSGHLASRIAR